MAPQHVEIAETIAALKRAVRREKEGILTQYFRRCAQLDLILTCSAQPLRTNPFTLPQTEATNLDVAPTMFMQVLCHILTALRATSRFVLMKIGRLSNMQD